MKRMIASALLVCVAIPADSSSAAPSDCKIFSNLMSDRVSDMRSITAGWHRNGVVLSRRGDAMRLPAFEDCDIGGDSNSATLECYWRFGDLAEATERFDLARAAIAPCMPKGLTVETPYSGEALRYHNKETAEIETDTRYISFEIDLIEFFGDDGDPSRYWVSIEFENSRS